MVQGELNRLPNSVGQFGSERCWERGWEEAGNPLWTHALTLPRRNRLAAVSGFVGCLIAAAPRAYPSCGFWVCCLL